MYGAGATIPRIESGYRGIYILHMDVIRKRVRLASCVAALLWATDSNAVCFITVTLYGDSPALTHVAQPLPDAFGIGPNATVRSRAFGAVPGLQREAGSLGGGSPATVLGSAPNAVIPGIARRRSVAPSEQPLLDAKTAPLMNDSRFMDEADENAARARFEAETMQDPGSPPAQDDRELAEAIRAAAEAARTAEVDETVQGEIAAELDDNLSLIAFGELEFGELISVTDSGCGVFGLVRVAESSTEDEIVVDEKGHLVTVEDGGEESDLLQWQAKSLAGIPGSVAAAPIGADGLGGHWLWATTSWPASRPSRPRRWAAARPTCQPST
jgi:hypothetical protein